MQIALLPTACPGLAEFTLIYVASKAAGEAPSSFSMQPWFLFIFLFFPSVGEQGRGEWSGHLLKNFTANIGHLRFRFILLWAGKSKELLGLMGQCLYCPYWNKYRTNRYIKRAVRRTAAESFKPYLDSEPSDTLLPPSHKRVLSVVLLLNCLMHHKELISFAHSFPPLLPKVRLCNSYLDV